ncbi:glycosyltransferase [Luteimonas sp. MJ293]|uniref:glycosyltransferase n=1 Tax=Luteimonas sp. MJ146 TaxID=3129240 RepID=UPI0031BB6EE0
MQGNVRGTEADAQDEETAEFLQVRLRRAERKLANALEQAELAEEVKRQLLSSTSWKITAPLRSLRTLMGAPPSVDALLSAGSIPAEAVTQALELGDSLIPATMPETMLAKAPFQAERSNEACEILQLDLSMQGLLPDELLQPGQVGISDSVSTYFGQQTSPPRIAFLGTPELGAELAFEAAVTAMSESGWRSQLAASNFSMLLLEPVWHVGNREWRGCMAEQGKGRESVEAMLAYARDRGVPTVLWFRGAPGELEHFGWLAQCVDAVYAVDIETARQLGDRAGRQVDVLAPAIQPAIHNPLRSWEQLSAPEFDQRVLFDGWLDLLEGAAEDPLIRHFKETRLLIAESEWEFGGVRLNDSPDFKRNAAGCLTPVGKAALARMVGAEIYRRSPLVPDWRREQMIQRSIACGTIVADSAGDADGWAGLPLRGGPDDLARQLDALLVDPLGRARMRHLAFRELFTNHCLADRLNRISSDVSMGVHFGRRPATVACLLITMRPELLASCLERFRADRYPHKELVVVLHGPDFSLAEARALVRPGEPISIFQLGKQLSLGDCLNFAAAQSEAEYWAKLDDDDIYGPNYLSDIMLYRRATDFPLGGKPAAFIYSDGDQEIRWDPRYGSERALQYRRANRGERIHIAGGTLIGKREVLREVPFSDIRRRGSDTDLLRRADAAGIDFVAFDFFNFALFRSAKEGFHTWNSDMEVSRQRTVAVGGAPDVEAIIHA